MKRLQKTQRCVSMEFWMKLGFQPPRGNTQPSLQLYMEQGVVGNHKQVVNLSATYFFVLFWGTNKVFFLIWGDVIFLF